AQAIKGVAADQAVTSIDSAADSIRAAPPGHRPAAAVPARAADYEVAVGQGGDVPAHAIIGGAADQAVVGINCSADPGHAAAPRCRPAVAVPARAGDHVVAIAQDDDVPAHLIISIAADQAVAGIDGAANPTRTAAPSHCSAPIVPSQA